MQVLKFATCLAFAGYATAQFGNYGLDQGDGSGPQIDFSLQTEPFTLELTSVDRYGRPDPEGKGKYDRRSLTACHAGQFVETLCLMNQPSETKFYMNVTRREMPFVKGMTQRGFLSWRLPYDGGGVPRWEYLSLSGNVASNVALAVLQPTTNNAQLVTFESSDLRTNRAMRAVSYNNNNWIDPLDWNKAVALDRWYICPTVYMGYQYMALSFVQGKAIPTNHDCERVMVQLKWVNGS